MFNWRELKGDKKNRNKSEEWKTTTLILGETDAPRGVKTDRMRQKTKKMEQNKREERTDRNPK